MKIIQFGTVTLTTGDPKVEGWLVEREPDDPAEATTEQLLLAFAIHWARKRFDAAVNSEVMSWLKKEALRHLEQQAASASEKLAN